MQRYQFQDIPGRLGSAAGLPANPLTGIEQLVKPPAGAHRDLLVRLGYPWGGVGVGDEAIRTTRLSRTIFALEDAGLLGALDAIFIRAGTLAGNLVNLVPGKADATVVGGVTYNAHGPLTNGIDGYIDLSFGINAHHYSLNSACIFAVLDNELSGNGPLIGRISGSSDLMRLYPSTTGDTLSARINSEVTLSSGTIPGPNVGVFLVQREDANTVAIYRNGAVIGQSASNASTVVPTNLAIGRNSGTFIAANPAIFGYGRALSSTERSALVSIIQAHMAII